MSLARPEHGAPARGPRSLPVRVALGGLGVLLFTGFLALGTWQVERRAWKLALIERVAQRVHAPAVDAPAPSAWPRINAEADEYRAVRLSGLFLHELETLVQASTERGTGFWVMTPLRQADGHSVLVNRGFVPPERRERSTRGAETNGPVSVTGLLRMSEPSGGFPRRNVPEAERWFSRDVAAIAAARGLVAGVEVAPYFVDAGAEPAVRVAGTVAAPGGAPAWPVGGLTVIAFHNSHLVYALTWYALALMVVAAAVYVVREERRAARRPHGENACSARQDDPDADAHP